MSIANKSVYAAKGLKWIESLKGDAVIFQEGINFKEALILHLATNPEVIRGSSDEMNIAKDAKILLLKANAIIQEIDKEK